MFRNALLALILIFAIFCLYGMVALNKGYAIHFLFGLALVALLMGLMQEKKSR